MEALRTAHNEVQDLDQRGVINLKMLQKWILLTILSFMTLNYLWNWSFQDDLGVSHFPFDLLTPEQQKKVKSKAFVFNSEMEARATVVREVEFAIVACVGEKSDQDKVAQSVYRIMKSVTMLTKMIVHFHVFTEDSLYMILMNELDKWPLFERHHISFEFKHASFPESLLSWRNLYKPCSSFKLFLPTVLRHVNHVIYVDIDAVFLSPIDELWELLNMYNESQVISVAPALVEDVEESGSKSFLRGTAPRKWYKNHAKIPYYGKSGLNSGVILFDNFKLQHTVFKIPVKKKESCGSCQNVFDFYETADMTWNPLMMMKIYEFFGKNITMPDQDILNIIFAFNPEKLHTLPCGWNYRWNFCRSKTCNETDAEPSCSVSSLVHSNGGSGYDLRRHPELYHLNNIFDKVKFARKSDIETNLTSLVLDLQKKLTYSDNLQTIKCALKNAKLFLKTFLSQNFLFR